MRWFRLLFVTVLIALPIAVYAAIMNVGRYGRSCAPEFLTAVVVYLGAAVGLRSRLIAWTMLGFFVAVQAMQSNAINPPIYSPDLIRTQMVLSLVCGIVVGILHDWWAEASTLRSSTARNEREA